jgi:alanine racemase
MGPAATPSPLRPSWLEVDLDAARANLILVRELVGAERTLFAVVKADGYGFGAATMGRAFLAAGADALAVADAGEGVRLRGSGITAPILVYPNGLPAAMAEVVAHGLTPTVTELEGARAVAAAAPPEGHGAFVKVDVGLERLGVPAESAVKTIRTMLELPGFRLAGVCAHPHAPAGADGAYVDWQLGRFTAVLDELAAQGVDIPIRLLASTPLVLRFPHTYLNAVDPGRMLYAEHAPFPVTTPMRFGVIPLGVADGLLHLNAGHVLVGGRIAQILGPPSLEHTRVDLSGLPAARVGDEVVVIGRQEDAEITAAEVATRQRIAPHQIATLVGPRVERIGLSAAAS